MGGGYKVSVEEYQVGKREMARKGSMVFGEAISLLALNIIKQTKRGEIICNLYTLPPEWIFQPDPFWLAQTSPAEWIQG